MITYKQRLRGVAFSLLLGVCGAAPAYAQQAAEPLPLEELRTFAEVFDRIKQAYVEDIDDRELLEYAIRGMLSGLDPHSAYLEPTAYKDLQVNTSGEFGGLGLEVGLENGFVKVITPIDDTPAARAGLQAGDLIIKLDDTPIKGLGLMEAVELMRGEPGSTIELTLMREGVEKPFTVTLTRDIIKVASVKHRLLEPGYGYIRISQFQMQTGPDVLRAIERLQREIPLKGLVLDLRNNPGGVLQAAVDVTDAFLDDGLIVYTKGRIPNVELSFSASPDTPGRHIPLVVLINGGTASASEIVAGALQDHQRAVIMGTDSFGKGSVQTVLPLNNDRALKLTTALYYTPSGRSIQAQGIVPDIRVQNAKLTQVAEAEVGFKEADLEGHLANGNGDQERSSASPALPVSPLADEDYQLYEALNLLKGLHILSLSQTAHKPNLTEPQPAE